MLLEALIGNHLLFKIFGLSKVFHPATGLFFVANDRGRDHTATELQPPHEGLGAVALPLEDAEMIGVEQVHLYGNSKLSW
jgi:hypothetical protein